MTVIDNSPGGEEPTHPDLRYCLARFRNNLGDVDTHDVARAQLETITFSDVLVKELAASDQCPQFLSVLNDLPEGALKNAVIETIGHAWPTHNEVVGYSRELISGGSESAVCSFILGLRYSVRHPVVESASSAYAEQMSILLGAAERFRSQPQSDVYFGLVCLLSDFAYRFRHQSVRYDDDQMETFDQQDGVQVDDECLVGLQEEPAEVAAEFEVLLGAHRDQWVQIMRDQRTQDSPPILYDVLRAMDPDRSAEYTAQCKTAYDHAVLRLRQDMDRLEIKDEVENVPPSLVADLTSQLSGNTMTPLNLASSIIEDENSVVFFMYAGDYSQQLVSLFQELVACQSPIHIALDVVPAEWERVFDCLRAGRFEEIGNFIETAYGYDDRQTYATLECLRQISDMGGICFHPFGVDGSSATRTDLEFDKTVSKLHRLRTSLNDGPLLVMWGLGPSWNTYWGNKNIGGEDSFSWEGQSISAALLERDRSRPVRNLLLVDEKQYASGVSIDVEQSVNIAQLCKRAGQSISFGVRPADTEFAGLGLTWEVVYGAHLDGLVVFLKDDGSRNRQQARPLRVDSWTPVGA